MAHQAFSNDRSFRRDFLRFLRTHVDRGACCRGTHGAFTGPSDTWQGTAVVCALRAVDLHYRVPPRTWETGSDALARAIDVPCSLIRLFDWVYENIPDSTMAQNWPMYFFEEIPLGADLVNAWPQIAELLPSTVPQGLSHLLHRHAAAETVTDDEWHAYRLPNGLGIAAAASIGEILVYVVRTLTIGIPILRDTTVCFDPVQLQALLRCFNPPDHQETP